MLRPQRSGEAVTGPCEQDRGALTRAAPSSDRTIRPATTPTRGDGTSLWPTRKGAPASRLYSATAATRYDPIGAPHRGRSLLRPRRSLPFFLLLFRCECVSMSTI